MDKKDRKQLGKHDWVKPLNINEGWCNTFSVGIFQWQPTTSGNGIKKGKSFFRIKGNTSHSEAVFERAEHLCDSMDGGYIPSHKSESFF